MNPASGTCSTLPSNSVYYGNSTGYTLSGALPGTSLTGTYSGSPTINTCQYTCASGYGWNGSSCILANVNGACTSLPSNAVYYGSATV